MTSFISSFIVKGKRPTERKSFQDDVEILLQTANETWACAQLTGERASERERERASGGAGEAMHA